MAECSICKKTTAVSLYIRVKPVFADIGDRKLKSAPRKEHRFFGYWPPESHLAEYFRLELARKESILQPLFENNCRGHSFKEITEAIEQLMPPIPGVPIRILWNPSPKVTPFLLAETWRQKQEAKLEINNDLRMVTVYEKSSIQSALKNLFNNAEQEITQTVSYPVANGVKPIMQH